VVKNDFFEVDEAMFQDVERPYVLIFSNQSIEKSDSVEIAQVIF
jgi:hypothetical protein